MPRFLRHKHVPAISFSRPDLAHSLQSVLSLQLPFPTPLSVIHPIYHAAVRQRLAAPRTRHTSMTNDGAPARPQWLHSATLCLDEQARVEGPTPSTTPHRPK